MSTVALTGADTAILNNRILADFADGDWADMTFPNDIAALKTGKNGNTIYALNETGKQCELKIRLIIGSPDDIYFNGLLAGQLSNFAGTVLNIGNFVKRVGDGAGNIKNVTYIMSGGILTKIPGAKSNAEGELAQSVVEWIVKFSNAPRVIR